MIVGRFAPSPTGPMHLGTLFAAVSSFLSARSAGGRWLVRLEDLDTPRVVAGSANEILRTLEDCGLEWDGEVEYQSQRHALYEQALETLRLKDLAYDCSCSRADLQRMASAPAAGDPRDNRVYPGTCRLQQRGGVPSRAVRFVVPDEKITFDDRVAGRFEENVKRSCGDFVIKRADGPFAYQLAVVVDDALQGVTEVVRGGDLLDSTARQIVLQRALEFPTPAYAHLPLLTNEAGAKLSKRDGAALALRSRAPAATESALHQALELAIAGKIRKGSAKEMLAEAISLFDVRRLAVLGPNIVVR